jgi:DNA-binding NarL/FixJ family response regulator
VTTAAAHRPGGSVPVAVSDEVVEQGVRALLGRLPPALRRQVLLVVDPHRPATVPPATVPPAGVAVGHGVLPLTARERQALRLLADGRSNKQVARALDVSFDSAKRLVSTVLLKLGAANRTAAVVRGIAVGLLEPADRP